MRAVLALAVIAGVTSVLAFYKYSDYTESVKEGVCSILLAVILAGGHLLNYKLMNIEIRRKRNDKKSIL